MAATLVNSSERKSRPNEFACLADHPQFFSTESQLANMSSLKDTAGVKIEADMTKDDHDDVRDAMRATHENFQAPPIAKRAKVAKKKPDDSPEIK